MTKGRMNTYRLHDDLHIKRKAFHGARVARKDEVWCGEVLNEGYEDPGWMAYDFEYFSHAGSGYVEHLDITTMAKFVHIVSAQAEQFQTLKPYL